MTHTTTPHRIKNNLKQPTDPRTPPQMTMVEHLSELRNRIVIVVCTVLVAITGSFFMSLPAIELLKLSVPIPVRETLEYVQLSPGEVLMASFRMSLIMGLTLASPVILYQLIRFVLPGLENREKVWLLWVVMGGSLLFIGGIIFSYYAVIPSALTWLLQYGAEVASNQISVARFVDFSTSLLFMTGLVFELPIVLLGLSLTGLVSSKMLLSQWRMATVLVFLMAAIITPSQDPVSLLLVGGAMFLLYIISAIPIKLIGR